MAFKPTDMQKKAIETKGNVLVSAAAGSGKTAVLAERVINMLTDEKSQISADRLLIVTFTNAAAAEMRNRIEKRLYEEIQKKPDDVSLQRQKYLLNGADICTIDSFCIKLVRENFERCGVEPDFKVSDGSGQKSTCNTVMSELMAEYFEKPSKEFLRLLELAGCEYDEKKLTELISRIYLYSQQLPFPENFIDGLLLPYQTDFTQGHPWYDMAFSVAEKRIEAIKIYAQKAADAAPYINKNCEKFIAYSDTLLKTADKLEQTVLTKNWNQFFVTLCELSFDRSPSAEKGDGFADSFKENQKRVKDTVKELRELFYADSDFIKEETAKNFGAVKLLTETVKEYGNRLFAAFCEENAFTFYNMEQLALKLLCEYKDGEIVICDETRELCERYDEVLVDEFQDVNDLQNMLFYVLSNREEKLFAVGDIKQSIYGFRGSNPDNFLNKKNKYVPIEKANESDPKKIFLSDNFRSRKGVCDAVNFFFSHLMSGQCGSIVYDSDEQLNAGGSFPESDAPAAELLVLDKYDADSEKTLLEREAERIAEYILSVMDEGEIITDGNTLRKARFCDFAILLEAVKGKADIIAQCLSDYGIPVSLGSDSFLESIEISTVMSLLQVIDNPKCDVELLSAMMSPSFAFTAEEMAKIRANQKRGPLYSAVKAYSDKGDKKAADFVKKLAELRCDAVVLPLDALVSKLIHSTDILNEMSALAGGKIRRANLYMLIKFAKDYTERSGGGIYGFIKYMNSLPDTAFKVSAAGGENAVKIMSMHNSKGLQFPVCIVANLASQINNADSISRVIFYEKSGIAFKYYDETVGCDIETLGHMVLSEAAQIKTVEERMRLLYVAATRAIDRLCLVCSAKNLEKKLKTLSAELLNGEPYIGREFLEKSRCMGDWVLSCALLHPAGEVLCDYADIKTVHCQSGADIKINIVNSVHQTHVAAESGETPEECDCKLAEKIKSNADYRYPYEALQSLQAKASVSSIVHKAEGDRFAFCERPAFMADGKLSGAAKGTAMHHIMQFINFEPDVDVTAEIERLVEWRFITEQEAESCNKGDIEAFFKSNIYRRILASKSYQREMRFITEIPANRIDPKLDADIEQAAVIVQGAIDLCFEEDDSIVVLDFKTDRVDNMNELVNSYGEQLEIYSAAAQKIFSKPVKERIIYSFALGESISF